MLTLLPTKKKNIEIEKKQFNSKHFEECIYKGKSTES